MKNVLKTVKWKTNSVCVVFSVFCILFHMSPTIQGIQMSISALGSSDKDEDETQEVQHVALWPEAPSDIDSEKLRLYLLVIQWGIVPQS